MDGSWRTPHKQRYLHHNQGELNDKGQVVLPQEMTPSLLNGFTVANTIKVMLAKAGQQPSSHLKGVEDEETKAAKIANWNFIWYDMMEVGFASKSWGCNLTSVFEILSFRVNLSTSLRFLSNFMIETKIRTKRVWRQFWLAKNFYQTNPK